LSEAASARKVRSTERRARQATTRGTSGRQHAEGDRARASAPADVSAAPLRFAHDWTSCVRADHFLARAQRPSRRGLSGEAGTFSTCASHPLPRPYRSALPRPLHGSQRSCFWPSPPCGGLTLCTPAARAPPYLLASFLSLPVPALASSLASPRPLPLAEISLGTSKINSIDVRGPSLHRSRALLGRPADPPSSTALTLPPLPPDLACSLASRSHGARPTTCRSTRSSPRRSSKSSPGRRTSTTTLNSRAGARTAHLVGTDNGLLGARRRRALPSSPSLPWWHTPLPSRSSSSLSSSSQLTSPLLPLALQSSLDQCTSVCN